MRFRELRGSSRFFTFLSLPFPTFFCVFLSHRSFRFRCSSRTARLEIQGFSEQILPNGVEIIPKTEGSTFYFQSLLPYLCTCTITIDAQGKTMWRKGIQSGNEMRNFTEVLGLHNYRILIFVKMDLSSGIHFVEMVIAYKNGTAIREVPMKEKYGLPILLISDFLQGCATKHESGH